MTKITKHKRNAVHERDGYVCLCCGNTENLTIDHIKPVCKGGVTEIWNLQTLCNGCNHFKDNQEIDYREWPEFEPVEQFDWNRSLKEIENQRANIGTKKPHAVTPKSKPVSLKSIVEIPTQQDFNRIKKSVLELYTAENTECFHYE